ncbi:hypothetical protein BCIN_06g01030 [Botrytis cinerea B05.10]|uniref:Uncharacterized protein n=1 Tax=Botryotinia fuckeliana (strain B05.10) TaxID=332648 RepID=A0A384JJ46_BOTFB|nr:hypothetical protein BCIN_06g01030 [Botrytis cinerea B05.10]ATZ50606.1 hypothetical protein BCIN_06g01030 [Botrytis cinerea B05.10]
MGSSTAQNISQRQSHTYQKSASSIVPTVHGVRRTYQAPSNPPFVHHENEYTESRTLSTRASLPSLHTTMFKQANATSAMLRPSSAHTSKRAVSGMKRLLPLRLATPPLSEDSEDSDSHSTSTSCKRSTFGQLERLGDLSDLGNMSQRRLHGTSLLAIRPEKYRDTPIISTDGSPLIGSPLYQESCTKWDEIECTTSCIIDAYEGLSDSSSSKGCGWDDSNHDTHETQSATLSPLSPRRRHQADSELSFKCMGEENEEVGEGEEGEQSESSWFAGSKTQRRVTPRLSTLDIEEWLDDSESSMCESSDDESDDFFACATALAPAKAQVIHVNHKKTQSLSITIPERSLPVEILKHSDSSALRRLTSRSPIETSPMEDLAMSSPPTSPDEPEAHKFSNFSQRKISRSPADLSPTPASPDTILDIVAAIEECTSNFPTKMLLADTPCISSIRSHLKATSTVSFKSFQRSKQPPAPPAPSTTTLKPPHHKGLNRRNRPQTICLSPTETKSFNFSIPTTPPVTPPFSPDFTFSSLAPDTTSAGPSPILPTFAYQLAAANLQPLHAIFPVSSDFLRSALYAHILAYIFLQSLPSSTPPSSTPLTRTPTIKHSHSASHSLRKSSFHNTTFSSYTYNNTSLVGIPAKAASTLGLSSSTSIRRNGTLGGGAAASQNKKIELNLKTCIGKLLKGMQGSVDVDGNGKEVEGWVLRSLVEVVRGCEGI